MQTISVAYTAQEPIVGKTDKDVLNEHHQFLRDENESIEELEWGDRVARLYYQKLFKEYAIADLSR